jgi:hypothetical protein
MIKKVVGWILVAVLSLSSVYFVSWAYLSWLMPFSAYLQNNLLSSIWYLKTTWLIIFFIAAFGGLSLVLYIFYTLLKLINRSSLFS